MTNKDLSYDDILYRIGYFRNKNKLSARDASLQLGYSESFVNRIERKKIELKMSTLQKFLEIVGVSQEEFFYYNPENYQKDKELLALIKSLSAENKNTLIELAKKLK